MKTAHNLVAEILLLSVWVSSCANWTFCCSSLSLTERLESCVWTSWEESSSRLTWLCSEATVFTFSLISASLACIGCGRLHYDLWNSGCICLMSSCTMKNFLNHKTCPFTTHICDGPDSTTITLSVLFWAPCRSVRTPLQKWEKTILLTWKNYHFQKITWGL